MAILNIVTAGSYMNDNRFLGNKNTKRVHDLNNEKKDCQISEIKKAGHDVYFSPDTLEQAHKDGYKDDCDFCIKKK